MKKEPLLTASLKRHLELVSHYYEIDHENKIIHLRLHYEKVEEILESDIGDKTHPSFRSELVARIADIINTLPVTYHVDVELQIADYQGYDPKLILESFNDEFEFNHFCANKDSTGRALKATVLVMVAVIIIFAKAILSNNGALGTGIMKEAYDLIFETVATLFIWEAGTVLFLSNSSYRSLGNKILIRVNQFVLLDGEGKVLIKENNAQMIKDWVETGREHTVGGSLLCFFSGAILVAGFSKTLSEIISVVETQTDPLLIGVYIFVYAFLFVVALLSAVSGYSYYCDKGPLKKACGFFAIFFALLTVLSIGADVADLVTTGSFSWSVLLQSVANLLSDIGFAVGYFMLRQSRKREAMAHAAQ